MHLRTFSWKSEATSNKVNTNSSNNQISIIIHVWIILNYSIVNSALLYFFTNTYSRTWCASNIIDTRGRIRMIIFSSSRYCNPSTLIELHVLCSQIIYVLFLEELSMYLILFLRATKYRLYYRIYMWDYRLRSLKKFAK